MRHVAWGFHPDLQLDGKGSIETTCMLLTDQLF